MPPRTISSKPSRVPHKHEILGDVSRFGGKYVFLQPVVERVVLGNPAEKAHGGVRVAVDESGQHQCAARVDHSGPVRLRFEVGAFADGYNRMASNRDAAVFDDAPLRVHGDDRSTADE